MNHATRNDIQYAASQLRAELLHTIASKQDVMAQMDRVSMRLSQQIREHSIISRQIIAELNTLHRRVQQMEDKLR